MTPLNEFLKLRTENIRELTHLELDENFQYVSNPWKAGRAYKEGMIVYYGDLSTGGSGTLSWFRANQDNGPSNLFDPSKWDAIGANALSGSIFVKNGLNVINSTSLIEFTNDFIVTFTGNTATVELNPGAVGFWQPSPSDTSTIYYDDNVLIGTDTPINPNYQLTVAGNQIITGNLTVSGLINGINLVNFFNDYNVHTHTISPVTLANYASLYPDSNGALADVQINTVTLATDQVLAWDNSIKRWINKSLSVGAHSLGSHTDVAPSVSIAPLNNQILRYNTGTGKWENITVVTDPSNGFSTAPFAHNHDSRYWTKTQLLTNLGPVINYANIFGAPAAGAPTNAEYVVISTNASLTDERVLTQGTGITIVDSGANGPVTINVEPKTTNQKVEISLDNVSIGVRSKINFVTSPNITYNITDDSINDVVNIEIDSSTLAPVSASYVVIGLDPTLTDERVLTGSSSINIADGGANSPVTLTVIPKTTQQKVEVAYNGTPIAVRSRINFNDTLTNVTYTITDDPLNDSVDVNANVTVVAPVTSVNTFTGNVSLGISELDDVVIAPGNFPGIGVGSPLNPLSNILVYDDDIAKWVNIPASSLIGAISNIYLNDLLDVEISATSLTDKQIVYYDQGSGLWVNGMPSDIDVYTITELQAGALDNLYYTETELSTSGSGAQIHWNNLTNVPSFAPATHSHYLYQLIDVKDYSMNPPNNGDIIVWNSVMQYWEAQPNAGGSGFSTIINNYSGLGSFSSSIDETMTISNTVPLKFQNDNGIILETDTVDNIIKIGVAVDGVTIGFNTAGELTFLGQLGDSCISYTIPTLIANTPYTFTNSTNTDDLVLTIYDENGYVIDLDIQVTPSNITIQSAVTLNNVRVVLLSCGGGSGSGTIDLFGDLVSSTPTDGTFTDGVFQWNDNTKIIDAFDDLNELLSYLIPPKGPALSDWTGSKAGTNVNGKLSFDTSSPISFASYIGADIAPSTPISVDGTWTASGKRLGITPYAGDVTGVLNDQVTVHPGLPTPAYAANTFGDADQGELRLYVNGILTNTLDLTSSVNTIDTTSGGTTSGFIVSAQVPSYFATGGGFATFQNRTGTWRVVDNDINIAQGYNYAYVIHYSTSFTRTLARFEWIVDDNTTPTVISSPSLHNLSMTGSKKISGIDYHTGGTALYNVTLDNLYRNTYYAGADAITHTGNSNSYGLLLSAAQQALGNCSGNEALQVNIVNKVATITSSGIRIINNLVSLNTTAKRTLQGTVTGGSSSINNILLDNYTSTSTLTLETFDIETYRLNDNSNYDLVSDVSNPSNLWDSTQSLYDGSVGHTTGLQVIDGNLIYPGNHISYPSDFRTSSIINGSIFNNGGTGGTGRNYNSCLGTRTYIRYFRQVSPTTGNFVMKIDGTGGTFVSDTTTLTGNNIHVHIKGPSETGWMDAYDDFVTGNFNDGDGARSATGGAGRAFGVNWGLTIGTKNTANTSGYMLVKITVGASFTGSFDKITWTFA